MARVDEVSLRDEGSGKLLFSRGEIRELSDEQKEPVTAAFKVLDERVSELRWMLS